MTRGAALLEALLVTLATPATWPLALGAFLMRGGIVLVTLPIIVLPTPVGAGNLVAPALTAIALGTLPPVVVAAAAISGVAVAGWLVLGGWLAAALEAEGARVVAANEDVRGGPAEASGGASPAAAQATPAGRVAVRILAVRLIALVPLAVALLWGSIRIVAETYRELTLPSETGTSLLVRVVKDTPDVLLAIALTWMLGEMVAAVAARRIALDGDGIHSGLRAGVVRTIRHPLTALVRFWLPTLALGLVVVLSAVAASSAWSAVGAALGPRDPFPVLVTVLLFVALWIAGLSLVAVVCAWRAAVWTIGDVAARGTFGGSTGRHPGDWRGDTSSATL